MHEAFFSLTHDQRRYDVINDRASRFSTPQHLGILTSSRNVLLRTSKDTRISPNQSAPRNRPNKLFHPRPSLRCSPLPGSLVRHPSVMARLRPGSMLTSRPSVSTAFCVLHQHISRPGQERECTHRVSVPVDVHVFVHVQTCL